MRTFFQHRRLTSLIVFLAILLNLCAPAISQTFTVLAADPLAAEICSSSSPAKQPVHAIKHCVLCATHMGNDAPPPAQSGLLAKLEGHDDYPHLPHATPAPALIWSDAQPRGPPTA